MVKFKRVPNHQFSLFGFVPPKIKVPISAERRPLTSARYQRNIIIAQGRLMRVLELVEIMLHSKCTIEELGERFNQSQRTIYRYLNLLEAVGYFVEKTTDYPVRYFIASDHCPLCGSEVKHG